MIYAVGFMGLTQVRLGHNLMRAQERVRADPFLGNASYEGRSDLEDDLGLEVADAEPNRLNLFLTRHGGSYVVLCEGWELWEFDLKQSRVPVAPP